MSNSNGVAVLAVCASSFISPAAFSAILTGFEQGLTGWDYLGDVSIQTSVSGVLPSQGAHMAFISTACNSLLALSTMPCSEPGFTERPFSGMSSPDAKFAREFLGLPGSIEEWTSLMMPFPQFRGEGGAMSFRFFAPEAGEVSFDWNKLGTDDAAYVSLWSDEGSARTTDWIYNSFTSTESFHASSIDLCSRYMTPPPPDCEGSSSNVETGWFTRSIQIREAGWYSIGFGMAESAEGTVPTAIALDNIRFNTVAAPIPEPENYLMWLLGIGAMGFVFRSHVRFTTGAATGSSA
jgi:hypothetical protein